MAWLDRRSVPLYHTTGNHTTYDEASENVFREMLSHLPRNGPPGQEGLAYFVRRGDLLLVFVNTVSTALGGEGRVECDWLERTLAANTDARHKLVFGHHPAHPVNGFAGAFQRDIERQNARAFWQVLVRQRVLAYFCSHILAFDVQVHDGVLQIVTAGAGTAHRMPPEHEYLHCVQAAVDAAGLRYQVLDTRGHCREWLEWPLALPASADWTQLPLGESPARIPTGETNTSESARLVVWRFSARTATGDDGAPQTLLCACGPESSLPALWIGLLGREQRLGVLVSPAADRSPHLWYGPSQSAGNDVSLHVAFHTGMGPGGILWRSDDAAPWSTLKAASPWGAERLNWPARWLVGHGPRGTADRPFRGSALKVAWHSQEQKLSR
jgi:hypothetical protein